MRAICATIFLLTSLGCRPDLERAEGSIEIVIRDPPPDANTLRVKLEAGAVAHELRQNLPAPMVLLERVPAGPAILTVEALTGDQLLAERRSEVTVSPDQIARVDVAFGENPGDAGVLDGATVRLVSDLIVGTHRSVRPQDDLVGDQLFASADLDGLALSSFVARARSELGSPAFTVREVRVLLAAPPVSENVGSLDELWDQAIFASLSDGAGLTEMVAEGDPASGALTATLAPSEADLSTLDAGLSAGTLSAGLRGHTPQTLGSDFKADVTISIVLEAR